jgi:hypothetical protein
VRWTVLIAVVIVALAVVYRMTPDRDTPRIRWASSEVISGVDEHDGYLRFGWQMLAADWTVALEATDFGEFDSGGALRRRPGAS